MDCFNGDHYFNTSHVAKTKTKAVNLQTVSLDIQNTFSALLGRSNLLHRSNFLVWARYLRITPAKTVNTGLLTKWVSIYS